MVSWRAHVCYIPANPLDAPPGAAELKMPRSGINGHIGAEMGNVCGTSRKEIGRKLRLRRPRALAGGGQTLLNLLSNFENKCPGG